MDGTRAKALVMAARVENTTLLHCAQALRMFNGTRRAVPLNQLQDWIERQLHWIVAGRSYEFAVEEVGAHWREAGLLACGNIVSPDPRVSAGPIMAQLRLTDEEAEQLRILIRRYWHIVAE